MSPEDQAAWDEMTGQLDFHNKPGHGWLDTLNRLWRKNRFVTSLDGMLKLAEPPPVLTRARDPAWRVVAEPRRSRPDNPRRYT